MEDQEDNEIPSQYLEYIDKSEYYSIQTLLALLNSVSFYYSTLFMNYIFANQEKVNIYKKIIQAILDCNIPLTKQIRLIILGNIVILNNEEFLSKLNNEFFYLLNITYEFLIKQKNEESSKLKLELKQDIDCAFLKDGEDDDDEK